MTALDTIRTARDRLIELRDASTPGPWELNWNEEEVQINAGTARTQWNETRTVGRPARSWTTTDRIHEVYLDGMDDREEKQVVADAELIVTLRAALDPQIELLSAVLEYGDTANGGVVLAAEKLAEKILEEH